MRDSLLGALQHLGTINNAAEIGVLEGDFSKTMLDSGVKFLYLIDPYLEDYMYKDDHIKKAKERMLEQLKHYDNKKFLEMKSSEASKLFSDGFFDYVYIDANHNYEFVKEDIACWYPKVRSGGVLGGHDFGSFSTAGVILAVSELSEKYKLPIYFRETPLYSVLLDPNGGDWYVLKP